MHVDSTAHTLPNLVSTGAVLPPAAGEAAPTASVDARAFDATSDHAWSDLLRDIVAVANSGGGRIAITAAIDGAEIRRRWADAEFVCISIEAQSTPQGTVSWLTVGAAPFPLQHEGTFYFRHGDRTEPATSADMREAFERRLRRVRRRVLRDVGRAFDAAAKSHAKRARRGRELLNLQPVRIVDDPNVPALHPQDVDRLYPWRQKDLVRELNTRLGRRLLNSYDIQAVRRHHRLDERPDFVFNLPGAGRRYSPAAAEWILDQFGRDAEFFRKARAADQEQLKLRRRTPK
jgi:hypothetical protein